MSLGKTILANGTKEYTVGSLLAKSEKSNFYICSSDGKDQCFLQIATDIGQNPRLDYASYVLKDLKKISDIYENKFQKLNPGEQLNYDWLFPSVVDSFIAENQGNRMVNILAVNNGDSLNQMVPLTNLRNKDRKIIDLATSVWIMGRMLKLLFLAHDQGISPMLDGDNIIIEPEKHHVVVLDWVESVLHVNGISDEIRKKDIKNAALVILTAMGEGTDKFDEYEGNVYVDYLKSLVKKPPSDIKTVYADFEAAHGQLFEDEIFYPFTTFSI